MPKNDKKAAPVLPPEDDARVLTPVLMSKTDDFQKVIPGRKDFRPVNEFRQESPSPSVAPEEEPEPTPPGPTNSPEQSQPEQTDLVAPKVKQPPAKKEVKPKPEAKPDPELDEDEFAKMMAEAEEAEQPSGSAPD